MKCREKRERPILFSCAMIVAVLEGRKTQTRRVVKHHPGTVVVDSGEPLARIITLDRYILAPYQAGDVLWVREKCIIHAEPTEREPGLIYYATEFAVGATAERWTPAIFMPRWASRISLRVMDVRAERLRTITEADAVQEGFGDVSQFAEYWDRLNESRGYGWALNPWVWVYSFVPMMKANG